MYVCIVAILRSHPLLQPAQHFSSYCLANQHTFIRESLTYTLLKNVFEWRRYSSKRSFFSSVKLRVSWLFNQIHINIACHGLQQYALHHSCSYNFGPRALLGMNWSFVLSYTICPVRSDVKFFEWIFLHSFIFFLKNLTFHHE